MRSAIGSRRYVIGAVTAIAAPGRTPERKRTRTAVAFLGRSRSSSSETTKRQAELSGIGPPRTGVNSWERMLRSRSSSSRAHSISRWSFLAGQPATYTPMGICSAISNHGDRPWPRAAGESANRARPSTGAGGTHAGVAGRACPALGESAVPDRGMGIRRSSARPHRAFPLIPWRVWRARVQEPAVAESSMSTLLV
jgi:hypothetical protein